MLPDTAYAELLRTTNRRYELNVEHSIRICNSGKNRKMLRTKAGVPKLRIIGIEAYEDSKRGMGNHYKL